MGPGRAGLQPAAAGRRSRPGDPWLRRLRRPARPGHQRRRGRRRRAGHESGARHVCRRPRPIQPLLALQPAVPEYAVRRSRRRARRRGCARGACAHGAGGATGAARAGTTRPDRLAPGRAGAPAAVARVAPRFPADGHRGPAPGAAGILPRWRPGPARPRAVRGAAREPCATARRAAQLDRLARRAARPALERSPRLRPGAGG